MNEYIQIPTTRIKRLVRIILYFFLVTLFILLLILLILSLRNETDVVNKDSITSLIVGITATIIAIYFSIKTLETSQLSISQYSFFKLFFFHINNIEKIKFEEHTGKIALREFCKNLPLLNEIQKKEFLEKNPVLIESYFYSLKLFINYIMVNSPNKKNNKRILNILKNNLTVYEKKIIIDYNSQNDDVRFKNISQTIRDLFSKEEIKDINDEIRSLNNL